MMNILLKLILVIAGIYISVVIISSLFNFSHNATPNPSSDDLAGIYKITEVKNLDFDKNTYSKYTLRLTKDGKFTLTPTPFVYVCDSGKYQVDYKNDFNELSFECSGGFSMAHIINGTESYQIEFMSDYESQIICFEKKK